MLKFVYMLLVALKLTGGGGGGGVNPLGSKRGSKTLWVGRGLMRLKSVNTWGPSEFRDRFIVKHL